MTQTLTPSWPRRLRHTPMRDLLRGRLTGRLDWRAAVTTAGLPGAARTLIVDVVIRTRLWRNEKADVARELAAHFADGLAAGASVETLIADFGDTKTAAALIRRAKQRQRSWVWTARRWMYYGLAGLAVAYVGVAVRYYTGAPTPTVDYVAALNRPVLAVPEQDRAWPIFVEAHQLLDAVGADKATGVFQEALQQPPGGANDAVVAAWVASHREGLDALHRVVAKPALGFVFGQGGSAGDLVPSERNRAPRDPLLVEIVLPHLNDVRYFAQCLHGEARVAATHGDGRTFVAAVRAINVLADQTCQPVPLWITNYISVAVRGEALKAVAETLSTRPEALDDAALVELAHLLAGPEVAGDLVRIDSERDTFQDMVQRTYTNDGHGDGRLTAAGFAFLRRIQPLIWGKEYLAIGNLADDWRGKTLLPAMMFTQPSRKTVTDAADRYFDAAAVSLRVPIRQTNWDAMDAAEDVVRYPERFGLLARMLPSLRTVGNGAERYLGRRDGVTVGLALELFRRRHGDYPKTLAELTPAMLPRVPVDRIAGGPVGYRLLDGRPVVYSVGFDRVDDGGRAIVVAGKPADTAAAYWPPAETAGLVPPQRRGDWVLYSGRALEGVTP